MSDRRIDAYALATDLNQDMLDETFLGGETEIHTVAVLTKNFVVGGVPGQYQLRFSDRAKYVGNNYYEGRAKFPDLKRTVGELVSPSIQFSEMEVELNNVDGFYNNYLVAGSDYFSFIGARLVISVGIRDVEATYFEIFNGFVPDEDGFQISRETITIRARDKADQLNKSLGLPVINVTDYPSAPLESIGKPIPLAIGNWEHGYSIISSAGAVSITYVGNQYDIVTDNSKDFFGGIVGYNVGGQYFVFCIGTHTPETIAACNIKRGNDILQVNFDNTPQNAAGYWVVQITSFNVVGGGTIPYVFQDGDIAMISVKVPYDTGKYSNVIMLAKEILMALGEVDSGEFDASWATLAAKNSPAQSDMTAIQGRVWLGKNEDKILEYVLSLLEQVRVELYWNNSGKIALRSIHPEDFQNQGSTRIEQIHINEESMEVVSDQRNFFNKAFASFAFTPILEKTQLQTKTRKNQNSIDKIGKEVIKVIDLPNLYIEGDAQNQIDEFIRFYSAGHQYVKVEVAWPMLLSDLTDIVKLNYNIGSIEYDNKPMKIRDITFFPNTSCLEFYLLSFANFPYDGNTLDNEDQMLSSQSQLIEDA